MSEHSQNIFRVRKWSAEQKVSIVLEHLGANTPLRKTAYLDDIDTSTLSRWIREFTEAGEARFRRTDSVTGNYDHLVTEIQQLRGALQQVQQVVTTALGRAFPVPHPQDPPDLHEEFGVRPSS